MSIRFLVATVKRDTTLLTGYDVLLPYIILSQSLNVVVTLLIVTRLLVQRRQILNVFGSKHAWQYVSIAAMVVESASLGSVLAITYLVLYGLKHPVQAIFLLILGQVTVCFFTFLKVSY